MTLAPGERPRVGLVLSGGLAWGLAHLGVIDVLEQNKVPVDVVAGTSVGSLIGALYAAGFTYEELEDLARKTHWRNILNLKTSRLGLVGMERFENYVNKHLGKDFAGLKKPLAVVACDLSSGEEIVFTSGPVARAVRASCALPGIFTPVEIEGRILVDGGVVNNLPVRAANLLGAEVIIAVDLGAHPVGWAPPTHIFQVFIQTLLLMVRCNVERETPFAQVVIRPEVGGLSFWDLDHVEPYLEAGRRAAEKVLPTIKAAVGLQ